VFCHFCKHRQQYIIFDITCSHVNTVITVCQMLRVLDQSEASLSIRRVSGHHFRSYTITATNDVGERRAFVELVRRRGHGGSRRPLPGERQSDGRAPRPTPRLDASSALSRPSGNDHGTAGE